jgi:alkylresorcinol/alkylpyrone synthase
MVQPLSSTSAVSLLGLATAVPPYRIGQAEAAELARRIFAPALKRFPQLADVFVNTGIETRYTVTPVEDIIAPKGWSERTATYIEGASLLFVEAARGALSKARLQPDDVDIVVTVSSTGIMTPSLDTRVAKTLGLRADVARIPVFGLGCAGGVSGLSIGARLARGTPGATVLVVAVELCTMAFRGDRVNKADVVSTAIFADGAAAAILRFAPDEPSTFRIGAAAEHTWPSTLDIMGWSIDPIGFGVILSRSLPKFIEEKFAEPARQFASRAGFAGDPKLICHPGGAKVVCAIEAALDLASGTLSAERETLRDYGNMSAPTALFVLDRSLQSGFSGAAILCAMGPGFTATFLAIEAFAG